MFEDLKFEIFSELDIKTDDIVCVCACLFVFFGYVQLKREWETVFKGHNNLLQCFIFLYVVQGLKSIL